MATEQASSEAPVPTNPEALMAERQIFWAQFCRAAVWVVGIIIVILVLLDWTLL